MAWRLAQTGKRILLLERGDYLPRERENWDAQSVFIDAKYQAKETWYGADGRTFHPGLHYFVGGNSKVYGAVLLRLRERDFAEIRHQEGISPGWPIQYEALSPTTRRPRCSITCMGFAARIPRNRRAPNPTDTRRFPMSRAFSSSSTA